MIIVRGGWILLGLSGLWLTTVIVERLLGRFKYRWTVGIVVLAAVAIASSLAAGTVGGVPVDGWINGAFVVEAGAAVAITFWGARRAGLGRSRGFRTGPRCGQLPVRWRSGDGCSLGFREGERIVRW